MQASTLKDSSPRLLENVREAEQEMPEEEGREAENGQRRARD